MHDNQQDMNAYSGITLSWKEQYKQGPQEEEDD
jgi:hypothetical protein